jgi:Tol biopolymer transport system component
MLDPSSARSSNEGKSVPRMTPHRRWPIAGAVVLALGAVLASTAAATTPGANGSIAFRRYFDANQTTGAVFVIAASGRNEKQLTTPPDGTADEQPAWAPDKSLITFTRCPSVGLCHLFSVTPDGSGLAPIGPLCPAGADETTCPQDSGASFSPDSRQLVFSRASGAIRRDAYTEEWIQHSAIAVMQRDGSGVRVVHQGAPFSGDLDHAVFSPDGKQIVYENISSSFSLHSGQRAVFVIRLDGSQLRRLTPWDESDGDGPDWSPDGRRIVFRSHVDEDGGQSQLFLIRPDGSGRRQVTHFAKGTQLGPAAFAPDGMSLVISKGTAKGNLHLFALGLDGSGLKRITHSPLWDSAPAWGHG